MTVRAWQAPLTRALGLYFLVESLAWIPVMAEFSMRSASASSPFSLAHSGIFLAWGPGSLLVLLSGSLLLVLGSARLDTYLAGPITGHSHALAEILDAQESILRQAVPLVGLLSLAIAVDPLISGLSGLSQGGSDEALAASGCIVAQGIVRIAAGVWLLRRAHPIARRLSRRRRDRPQLSCAEPTIPAS